MKARLLSPNLSINELYYTIIEQASEAIIYADFGSMIRFWNRGAERIFGFTAEEAIERSLNIIIPEHLRRQHWDAFGRTVRTGITRYGAGDVLAVPALRKDGTLIPVEFSIVPLEDKEGHVLGVAAIVRDANRHAEELSSLRKELTSLRNQLAAFEKHPHD